MDLDDARDQPDPDQPEPDQFEIELVVDGRRHTWCRLPTPPDGVPGGAADLAIVDLLARLQLTARRSGARIQVIGLPDATAEFVRFVGMADLLGVRAP